MRRFLVISCVVLAGCSAPQSNNRDTSTASAASNAADRTSGAFVTAAPGVAFNYHYAFRVPNAKIAAVQEEHAAACERLGILHCSITGMHYQLVHNDQIDAMLSFKLDPALARQFGKTAIDTVTKSEGMLVESEITGADAGAVIEGANREVAQAREGIASVEARLKQPGLPAGERENLETQARELRQQLSTSAAARIDAQKSLATTPMVFDYGSGNLIPGFDGRSPLHDAFAVAQGSLTTMVSVVLIAVGLLLPWAALFGLIYYGYWAVRRWRSKPTKEPIENQ